MDAKQKFNLVYNVAKIVMEQKTLYNSGYQFVQNKRCLSYKQEYSNFYFRDLSLLGKEKYDYQITKDK